MPFVGKTQFQILPFYHKVFSLSMRKSNVTCTKSVITYFGRTLTIPRSDSIINAVKTIAAEGYYELAGNGAAHGRDRQKIL